MPIPSPPEHAIAATPSRRAPPRAAAALAALSEATNRCRECPIGAGATQSVIGEGRLGARLMLVGEQPGEQEDVQGRPFVGPAGRLLDRALGALGWPREAVFVTNAVKHFKYELRGKRRIHKTPAQREVEACLHWLEDEIALVRPEAIVAMGATAARALLGRPIGVMSERGHWLEREADARRVLITLHPSALLRVLPAQRDAAYALWLRDLALASEFARAAHPAGAVTPDRPASAPAARPAPTARASARGSRRGDR
jgi:uracil-DNA glycosylase